RIFPSLDVADHFQQELPNRRRLSVADAKMLVLSVRDGAHGLRHRRVLRVGAERDPRVDPGLLDVALDEVVVLTICPFAPVWPNGQRTVFQSRPPIDTAVVGWGDRLTAPGVDVDPPGVVVVRGRLMHRLMA